MSSIPNEMQRSFLDPIAYGLFEDAEWDAPLFETDLDADEIAEAPAGAHDEVVHAVGVLWGRLATMEDAPRNPDGEILDEIFNRTSFDIGSAKAESLPKVGPSSVVPAWTTLRASLIRLLGRAQETGYVLEGRLVDHLPVQFVSADVIHSITGLLADQGIEVRDELGSGIELCLDSTYAGSCDWDEIVDEELVLGSDVYEDIAKIYFQQATVVPLLSRDEECSLARALEQARRSFLDAMTKSRLAMHALREMLEDVRAGRVRAQWIFDWSSLRMDIAPTDEESLDSEFHADSKSVCELHDPVARIRATCTELIRLLEADTTSGGHPNSSDQVEFAVLRDELVNQLAGTRFSCNAMRRITVRVAELEPCDSLPDELAKMVSEATACFKFRDRLIEANLRLVMWVARKYHWAGMPLADLLQEGNLGLMRAVDRFDYRREARFSTYATWWIRQGITRCIGNTQRVVRLPVHVHETLNKVRQAELLLDPHDGTQPSPARISEQIGLPQARVRQFLAYSCDVVYIDFWDESEAIVADYEAESHPRDGLADCGDAFEATARVQTASVIERVLSGLTKREAKILCMRFGIDGNNEQTLEEIGSSFGLTRERIRQIEAKGLKKLRHPVRRSLLETLRDGFVPKAPVPFERSNLAHTRGDKT